MRPLDGQSHAQHNSDSGHVILADRFDRFIAEVTSFIDEYAVHGLVQE